MSIDKKISILLKNQLPAFVREDYPDFIQFIEAYYEWMELTGNPIDLVKNMPQYADIDDTLEEYIKFFKSEYLNKLPEQLFEDPISYIDFYPDFTGTFIYGETITGQTSGATATFISNTTAPLNKTISIITPSGEFLPNETIVGDSSGATGLVYDYRLPIEVNKRTLVKQIRDFYRARGTEKSFKLLFRILFNEDVDFYYPRVDMLRPSDGKWQQDIAIRLYTLTGDLFEFSNKVIRGGTSNASAFVESVRKVQVGPIEVFELLLNRSSLSGEFKINEQILSNDAPGVLGGVYPILTKITVTEAGEGYSVGDLIDITQNGPGYGAQAKVSAVGNDGEVLAVQVFDFGVNYSSGLLTSEIVFPPAVTQAYGTATIGAVGFYPGYFVNEDGHLSSSKKIQDSYYYQQFSYVLKAEKSLEEYKQLVLDLLHPAGLKLFGIYAMESVVDLAPVIPNNGSDSHVEIQWHFGYSPYGYDEPSPSQVSDYTNDAEATNAAMQDGGQLSASDLQQQIMANINQNKINVPPDFYIQPYVLDLQIQDSGTTVKLIPVVDQNMQDIYVLTFDFQVIDSFEDNELIIGQNSGATARYMSKTDDNMDIYVQNMTGLFENGEAILGQISGTVGVLASENAITFTKPQQLDTLHQPSYRMFERFREHLLPNSHSLDQYKVQPPNQDYWFYYGNTQIQNIAEQYIKQFKYNPQAHFDIGFDALLTTNQSLGADSQETFGMPTILHIISLDTVGIASEETFGSLTVTT